MYNNKLYLYLFVIYIIILFMFIYLFIITITFIIKSHCCIIISIFVWIGASLKTQKPTAFFQSESQFYI